MVWRPPPRVRMQSSGKNLTNPTFLKYKNNETFATVMESSDNFRKVELKDAPRSSGTKLLFSLMAANVAFLMILHN